jgi:NAD(P)-dependent dehydrogenase (short-subunit alcohol dehydrogenase family)
MVLISDKTGSVIVKGQLEGKVVLVTGGSSGIGRASALAFAREGAKVVVNANLNIEGGEETVRMIKEAGGGAIFVKADASKTAEVEAMVKKTVKAYGRLDCAFNNAGVADVPGASAFIPEKTADYAEKEWDYVISVNLKGVWLCMKFEIIQMLKQGGGAIVNNSSILGLVGIPGGPAYVASKHGVIGLTKAAALEYAKEGIRVNAVCPGWIGTSMTDRTLSNPALKAKIIRMEPIGRMGKPEEVGEAVVWLCSDAASFVTGHSMVVDGGLVAQ